MLPGEVTHLIRLTKGDAAFVGRTAPLGFRLRHVPLLERFDLANFTLLVCLRNCEFGVYSQEKPRRRGGCAGASGFLLGGTVIAGDNHTTPYKPIGGVTKIVISDGLDKDGLCPARTKNDPRGFGRGRGNPKEKPRLNRVLPVPFGGNL